MGVLKSPAAGSTVHLQTLCQLLSYPPGAETGGWRDSGFSVRAAEKMVYFQLQLVPETPHP